MAYCQQTSKGVPCCECEHNRTGGNVNCHFDKIGNAATFAKKRNEVFDVLTLEQRQHLFCMLPCLSDGPEGAVIFHHAANPDAPVPTFKPRPRERAKRFPETVRWR